MKFELRWCDGFARLNPIPILLQNLLGEVNYNVGTVTDKTYLYSFIIITNCTKKNSVKLNTGYHNKQSMCMAYTVN